MLIDELKVEGSMWLMRDMEAYFPSIAIDWGRILPSFENCALLMLTAAIMYVFDRYYNQARRPEPYKN